MNAGRPGQRAAFSKMQWLIIGIAAALIGLASFVFAAIGLVLAAVLAAIFAFGAILRGNRGEAAPFGHGRLKTSSENPGEQCVDLGKDEYSVRSPGGKVSASGTDGQ